MASTYTTGFSLEKIGSGEQAGTWGTTTNHNLDIVDRLASYKAIALSDASTATLTVREASPGSGTENLQDGMYRAIKFTGSLSQDCTITIAPNTSPAWFIIENAAGDDIILSQGSGANVTVQNGKNVIVYCDGAGSGAAVVDALADLQIGTLECTGAAAIDGALTQGGASQFNNTITVGVDDTGYDVKFFGATSGAYLLWDESTDDLKLVGAAGLTVAGDIDVDGTTNLDAVDIDGATQIDGTITVGVDDTGYDVKFFGATSGAYMLWDESADDLKLVGAAGLTVAGDIDVDGTTNLDVVDVDGAVNFAADVTFADGADIITASAGTSNFRAGVNAGNSIESGGNYNVAIGDEAGTAITTGDNNVCVGYAAGDAITTAISNVAIGASALGATVTGNYNVAMGHQAGMTQNGAAANTLIGHAAGAYITSGGSNVVIGSTAGDAITTGTTSVIVGQNAGSAMTTASENVIIGNNCAAALTTGGQSIYIGDNAAASGAVTGIRNVVVGDNALYSVVAGGGNIALGYTAGYAITSGNNNVCIGSAAGDALTSGHENTYIGNNAGGTATTAGYNICIGNGTGNGGATTGDHNISMGHACADAITSGANNVAIGQSAFTTASTGSSNVCMGAESLYFQTTASSNVAIGHQAGKSITTGATNTCIGYAAGDALVDGANNIIIGNTADAAATNTSNSVTLGNGSISALRCQVQSISALSDRRDKKEIKDLDIGLDFINTLHPVKFTWNMRDGGKVGIKEAGFIAQELDESQNKFDAEEYLQLVLKDNPEKLEAAMGKLMPSMVKAVQELSAKVEELEKWKEEHTCCG